MNGWTDITSYQRGERSSGVAPRSWGIKRGRVCIIITNSHAYNPGRWSMSCSPFYDAKDMDLDASTPADVAQKEALRVVCHILRKAVEGFEEVAAN